jgi:hypothetical protein
VIVSSAKSKYFTLMTNYLFSLSYNSMLETVAASAKVFDCRIIGEVSVRPTSLVK